MGGVRIKKIQLKTTAPTLAPGYVNARGQVVVGDTGWASEARAGQRVYKLRCGACGLEYGVPGIEVERRACPGCQGGVAGERLRAGVTGAGLFD